MSLEEKIMERRLVVMCPQDSIQIYPIINSRRKLNVRGKTGTHVQIYLWTFDRGWLQTSIIHSDTYIWNM
jgi:hypothetical protein